MWWIELPIAETARAFSAIVDENAAKTKDHRIKRGIAGFETFRR